MKPSKRVSVKISTPNTEPKRVSIVDQKNYQPTIPYIRK